VPLVERTTVTKAVRRVAGFDWDIAERSVRLASPTQIAVNFIDYLDSRNYGVSDYELLSSNSIEFLRDLELRVKRSVGLIGTGPSVDHVVDRRHLSRFCK